MKNITAVFILMLLGIPALSQSHPAERPHILGIDHVAFYTTAPDGVRKLYTEVLGLAAADPVEPGENARYLVGTQWVGYSPAPDPKATDRMDHAAFRTDNIVALRRYLVEKGFKPSQIQGLPDHSMTFTMKDPEGYSTEFVERSTMEAPAPPASAVSRHMIHVGFLVYHQPEEDHFYREVLGFRPYWHGGMTDTKTEWVALQVPDGTDWVEYMVNQSEHPDLQLTGVMNTSRSGCRTSRRRRPCWNRVGGSPMTTRKRRWERMASGS